MPVLVLFVMWKTFSYAAPLASRLMRGAGRGAVLAGTVGTAAYVAGPQAAAAAARWGTRGAAGAMLAGRRGGGNGGGRPSTDEADDGQPDGGVPEYRRRENDPAYY